MSRLPDLAEFTGIIAGVTAAITINVVTKKPVYSGFHKHLILGGIGYGAGVAGSRTLDEVRRRRALHVEDYIAAHPEHFPELFSPEKKWKDVFDRWVPNR